jgi:hypothetical protein
MIGAGFEPFLEHPTYFCSVADESGNVVMSALAFASDANHILCEMPARQTATRAYVTISRGVVDIHPDLYTSVNTTTASTIPLYHDSIHVYRSDEIAGHNDSSALRNALTYVYYPDILSIHPSRCAAHSGALVNISGAGFGANFKVNLQFVRDDVYFGVVSISSDATFISETLLLAAAPIWNSKWNAGTVKIVWDTDLQTGIPGGWLPFEYDETVSSLTDTNGKASGNL